MTKKNSSDVGESKKISKPAKSKQVEVLNKKDLLDIIKKNSGMSLASVQSIFEKVIDSLKEVMKVPGREIRIINFGSFKSEIVPARTGINPKTREEINIDPRMRVVFKASEAMKRDFFEDHKKSSKKDATTVSLKKEAVSEKSNSKTEK